jgi:hypothetical protein
MSGGGGDALDLLVVANYDGSDATATRDFLFGFNAYSRHRFHYVLDSRRLGPELDLDLFDGVLVFWSASLVRPHLDAALRQRLRAARGLKVVLLQDEFQDVDLRVARLAEIGAQVIYTCVAERDHEEFYPAAQLPTLAARHTILPGYVPARLANHRAAHPSCVRPLDVGYRSRAPPFSLGDLARHKVWMSERLGPACRARGLRVDLSVGELDRLYGAAWVRFLSRARCVLGSPSGASVIDRTGEIRRNTERHLARHPASSYEEVRTRFFAGLDGRLAIDTVSSRVFEATALGCALVQVRGDYGGVLEPDHHYLAIAADYGNLDEVVAKIADAGFCRAMAATAHRELVASDRYSYRTFVQEFDAQLARHAAPRRGRGRRLAGFHLRRSLLHGQPFLPAGAGCVVVPLPLPLLTAGLRSLPVDHLPTGPVVGRLLRHPRGFVDKLRAFGGLLLRRPPARALLRQLLAGAAPVALARLVEDLLKLAVVADARRGALRSLEPFFVDVAFEAETGSLWLISRRPVPDPRRAPMRAPLPRGPQVRQVIWDHSEIGAEVTYFTGRRRPHTLSIGTGGVYRCEALATLCRAAPGTAVTQVLAFLGVGGAEEG